MLRQTQWLCQVATLAQKGIIEDVTAVLKPFMADIIALIRYTMQRESDEHTILGPFLVSVNWRFAEWLNEQERLR